MARPRRTSEALEIGRQRLAALKEINPKPDFGPGLTLEAYEGAIEALGTEQDAYNGDVSSLDEKTNLFDQHEQELAELNVRILAAVKATYGSDSSELEQLGAVRRSDRKKRTPATKVPATN